MYKTDENIHNPPPSVLPHDTQPCLSVCRKYVQSVSPLPKDSCDKFGGDPFTDDGPHEPFMRQVLYRNCASCGTVRDRTP